MTVEQGRLEETRAQKVPWKKWGPYLSERQWGRCARTTATRGNAWDYFSHDQARSRAYRWGEDGLAGISDDQQQPLLRAGPVERQGSHPQGAAVRPDQQRGQPRRGREGVLLLPRLDADALVHEVPLQVPAGGLSRTATSSRPTARRSRQELEYELLDTGVFDQDRYFDVFVEYAKASPEDMLIQITVSQPRPGAGDAARAADPLVPQRVVLGRERSRPLLQQATTTATDGVITRPIRNSESGSSTVKARAALLFTENETNNERLFSVAQPDAVRQGRDRPATSSTASSTR
mgnify:CR=1 FL=1